MATVTRREFWDRLELALYGKTGNTFGAATMIGIDELYDDLASPPAEVGCERPDGTLNIHSASEVCEVCSPRVEAAQTPPAKDAPCPACHGSGGDRWHESDGSEHGEKCPRCDGFGRAQAPPASAPPISAAWARVWQGVGTTQLLAEAARIFDLMAAKGSQENPPSFGYNTGTVRNVLGTQRSAAMVEELAAQLALFIPPKADALVVEAGPRRIIFD